MYNGIEIDHPVFRVLFCNLIATFISSAANVLAYPIQMSVKYSTIVNSTNCISLLFHCCSWLIVSLLRYTYIINNDWLFARFPDPKVLNRLAIASVFFTFLMSWFIITFVCWVCGWPTVKVFEMPMPQKAISIGALLGTYISLICFSCFFYLLILRKRGSLGNNKVENNITDMKVNISDIETTANHFWNAWIGDSHTNNGLHQDDNRTDSIMEEVIF
jgi:hypothetical protein